MRRRTETAASSVGALIRAARQAQQLTQEQVAALSAEPGGHPISRSALSSIERGANLPGLDALVALSRVLRIEPSEVLERVAIAPGVAVDLGGTGYAELRRRADEAFWAGNYRSALALCETMQRLLSLDPPADPGERDRLRARVEIDRAIALRRCGAVRASTTSALRAIEMADGLSTLQCEAYMVLAAALSHQSFLVPARDAAERAARLSDGGPAKLRSQAATQLGDVLFRGGHYEEARRSFLTALPLARKVRAHRTRIALEGNIGACLTRLGRIAQARKRFTAAVDLAREHGDVAAEAFWLIEPGHLALTEGRLDEADGFALAALRIAKARDQYLTVFRAEWLRHRVALARDPDDADRHRLAYLRKLFPRVKDHTAFDAVREFADEVLGREERR